MIPDTTEVLNDILLKKQSETNVTETLNLGKYQLDSIRESQVVSIITEDFSAIIARAGDIISKASMKMCDNVITYLTDSLKFVEKNRKTFEAMKDVDFYIEGFDFSTLSAPRINFSELDSVIKGYDKFVNNMNKQLLSIGSVSQESVSSQLLAYTQESNLAKVRASMLNGSDKSIDSASFLPTVKRHYRSGCLDKRDIRIQHPDIIKTLDNLDKIKDDTEKTKKELSYLNSRCNTCMDSIRRLTSSIMDKQQSQICLTGPWDDNTTQCTDTQIEQLNTCLAIVNTKYTQIVELHNIGETILGERLVALKEQIAQSITILNAAMHDARIKKAGDMVGKEAPTLKLMSGKPAEVYPTPATEASDYVEAALDQTIICEAQYNSLIEMRYIQEMSFIGDCVENQRINIVTEAGTLSKKYESVKSAIIQFVDKIVAAVREKIVAYNKRYIPWLSYIGEEKMIQKAKSMSSITMAPYFKGEDISGDLRAITAEIQKASKPTDKNSLDFTKKFLDGITTQEKYDQNRGDIPGYLKNYFRFHVKNVDKVKKEEVSGNDLAGKVSGMMKYIKNYETNMKPLANLSKTVERAVNEMDVTMESFNYLQLLECYASDTELGLLEGYQALLEEDTNTGNKEEKAGTVTNEKGETESPTTIETPEKKEQKEAEARGEKPVKSSKYANTFQSFFQLVIAAYVTAAEERFINYVNVLSELSGSRPTVDKDGKYVVKLKKEDKKKAEPTKESVLPQRFYDKPSTMKGTSMYQ